MPDNLNLNLDQNLNLNLGAMSLGGMGLGPRYNTDDFCRLAPLAVPPVVALPVPYTPNWDAEYRAWPFVREFVCVIPWPTANDPVQSLLVELLLQNAIPVPADLTPAPGEPGAALALAPGILSQQVVGVLNASIDRADRASEILHQADGVGALSYWTGMLRLDPATDTNTILLIRVARKIGEFVAMGLKDRFRMRRPAQVYPWIMPLIDGPDTPSYPSSHSLQAHLISSALKLALPVPQPPPPPAPWVFPPPPLPLPPLAPQTSQALDHLAYRVAYNREVAGVHFPMDSEAGRFVAYSCIRHLYDIAGGGAVPGPNAGPLFVALVGAAAGELANRP